MYKVGQAASAVCPIFLSLPNLLAESFRLYYNRVISLYSSNQ